MTKQELSQRHDLSRERRLGELELSVQGARMNHGTIRIERETHTTFSPWRELANAIVLRAVEDYRKAQADLRANPGNEKALRSLPELERFFRSAWFEDLTDLDGRRVLAKLRGEGECA